jgi:hypothetical protein
VHRRLSFLLASRQSFSRTQEKVFNRRCTPMIHDDLAIVPDASPSDARSDLGDNQMWVMR